MRGMFPRGWDEAGGTARGCDPGRAFGSTQQDEVQAHDHALRANAFDYSGSFCSTRAVIGLACCQMTTGTKPNLTPYCCVCDPQVPTQSAVQCSTGTETRPVNVALLPIIKYLITVAPQIPSAGISCSTITGKGALLTGTAANAPSALPVGTPGSLLIPNPTCAEGLAWTAPGANGQILMACSACANGTLWQTGAVGSWIDAGTIQSVGLGATTTAPTVGTTDANNVRYRQIGPKEWEAVYTFRRSVATGAATGSGDYLYTLPGGIQWDTTLPFQTAYNGDVNGNLYVWTTRGVPSGNGSINVINNASVNGFWIVPYDTTRFRVITSTATSGGIFPQGSVPGTYPITLSTLAFTFTFQVTTP